MHVKQKINGVKRGSAIWIACLLSAVVTVFVVVIISFVNRPTNRKEEHLNVRADLISTNVLQHNLWARQKNMRAKAIPFDSETWGKFAPQVVSQDVLQSLSQSNRLYMVVDPLDADTVFADRRYRVSAPKGYFVALYNLDSALHVECTYALEGKRVGYIDRSDFLFIQAIRYGYRMQAPKELRQIPIGDWDRLTDVLKNLDVIITYIIPGSDFHRLLQTQSLSLMGFRGLDADRIRVFYPYITLEQVVLPEVLRDVPGSGLRFMDREKNTFLPSMQMRILVLRGTYQENFESFRLRISPESQDPSYRCFGDTSIENKALCDSPYDVMGMPKRSPTVWDRPCIRNEDCPFYKANKNYENTRGGCMDGGVCEMPVGVKRVAYRLYKSEERYAPFCYGCNDPLSSTCCDEQWMPDYAFPNDQGHRKQQGMEETMIAMK